MHATQVPAFVRCYSPLKGSSLVHPVATAWGQAEYVQRFVLTRHGQPDFARQTMLRCQCPFAPRDGSRAPGNALSIALGIRSGGTRVRIRPLCRCRRTPCCLGEPHAPRRPAVMAKVPSGLVSGSFNALCRLAADTNASRPAEPAVARDRPHV